MYVLKDPANNRVQSQRHVTKITFFHQQFSESMLYLQGIPINSILKVYLFARHTHQQFSDCILIYKAYPSTVF